MSDSISSGESTRLVFKEKVFFVKDGSLYYTEGTSPAIEASPNTLQTLYCDSSPAEDFYDPTLLGKAIENKKSHDLVKAILNCMDIKMLFQIDKEGKTFLHRRYCCRPSYLKTVMEHPLLNEEARYALLLKPESSGKTLLELLTTRANLLSEDINLKKKDLDQKQSKSQTDSKDVSSTKTSPDIDNLNEKIKKKQGAIDDIHNFCTVEKGVAEAAALSQGKSTELHKLLDQLQGKVNYLNNYKCKEAAEAINELVISIRSWDYDYNTPFYKTPDNSRDEVKFKEKCLVKLNQLILNNQTVKDQLATHRGIVALFERIFALLFGQPKNSSSFFKTQSIALVEKLESRFNPTETPTVNLSEIDVTISHQPV